MKGKSMAKKKVEAPKSFDELFNRIECDTGLIFVDTPEESRVIREVFRKYKGHNVQFWSLTQGLIEIPKEDDPDRFLPHDHGSKKARADSTGQLQSRGNILNTFAIIEADCRAKIANENDTDYKSIYILRDADKFFQQPGPLRACRDLVYLASCSSSSIIVTGFGLQVPTDLEKDSIFIRIPYPGVEEIKEKIIPGIQQRIERHNRLNAEKDKVNGSFSPIEIARACAGLTEDQILNTIGYSTTVKREVSTDIILEEKRAVINKSDILEYWVCDTSLNDVGGFKDLKDWFAVRKNIMNHPEEAKAFGAVPPKGIMLLGVQGSGKTYIAKSVAADLGVGVIKLEMGKVFAGLVGESEKRMRMALAQAAAAGGVVVIDEIDKGLSGAGSSDRTDGGTTSRVIGTLLTWMSEEHPNVFIIATANDITALNRNHPELLRKGRFDEIWFSDCPTPEEREEIFSIHLRRNKRDPKSFDLKALAEVEYIDDASNKTYTYTGAEIEYSIQDAIQEAFSRNIGKKIELGGKDDVKTEDIIQKLQIIKPITFISKDSIGTMRRWAEKNARRVSGIQEKKKTSTIKTSNLNMRAAVDVNDIEI
jgi:SpoVK/Ycf46/Vps4 family AAA+-type ATPase